MVWGIICIKQYETPTPEAKRCLDCSWGSKGKDHPSGFEIWEPLLHCGWGNFLVLKMLTPRFWSNKKTDFTLLMLEHLGALVGQDGGFWLLFGLDSACWHAFRPILNRQEPNEPLCVGGHISKKRWQKLVQSVLAEIATFLGGSKLVDDVLFATKRTVDGKKDDYLIQLFSKRGKFDRGVG